MKYLELYANYLTIERPKEKGFTPLKCPFHSNGEEKDKSAGIDLSTGVFECKACVIKYSPSKFISQLTGKSIQEAGTIVDTYRSEKKLTKDENNFGKKFIFTLENPDWKELYLQSLRNKLEGTFAEEFVKEKGISLDTLKANGVGFLTEAESTKTIGDVLTFPYFYGGKLVGLRFRNETGSKSGLKDSLAIPWGLDELKDSDTFVIVVEGETDKLCLCQELKNSGINLPIISLPGSYFKSEWERDFNNVETIYFIPDSDSTGQKFAKEFKELYGDKLVVHNLHWQPRQLGKDLCDWCRQNDCKELIKDICQVHAERKLLGALENTEQFLNSEDTETEGAYISNFIYPGQIGIVGGPQKAKKSWLLLNLAKTLVTPGDLFLGLPNFVSSDKPKKVIYVQTEGSKRKWKERVKKITTSCEYPNNIFWWFKPGIKLDTYDGIAKLTKKLKAVDADILILDPFQRLHSKDEDKASETQVVWDNIFSLTYKFPKLAIPIVHHFGKDKSITDKWNALRGSSRMGGEVDFGIFMDNRKVSDGGGMQCIFEFRDEEKMETPDGKEIFKFDFDSETALITLDMNTIIPDKIKDLVEKVKEKGQWQLTEAQSFYGVSNPTINKWVKDSGVLKVTKPAPGKPSMIVVKA